MDPSFIIELIKADHLLVLAVSALLLVLLLWHVAQAFFKRLWLLPSHSSRILALNAATLALLAIAAKPSKPGNSQSDEHEMLLGTVLICAMIGAFMPSVAASSDLKDMWSNVIAVGLLVISVNFIIFLQLFYIPDYPADNYFSDYDDTMHVPTIYETAMEHKVVMASLFLLLLVLLMQAVALEEMMSDMHTIVSKRLEQVNCMERNPGYKADVSVEKSAWSWEVVERNTHVKLMMALTSNPQNVLARSPSAALVGALVLLCVVITTKKLGPLIKIEYAYMSFFNYPACVVCGFICVWRWVRTALQEDRYLSSLVFDAEPSYWRRKVNNFQRRLKAGLCSAQPNVLEEGQYGFQEVLCYTTAYLMLCFVIPFHRFLVAVIRFTHILSALLVRKVILLPIKALGCGIFVVIAKIFQKSCQVVDADSSSGSHDSLIGAAVCLEGEDACIVGREFAGAASRVIGRQLKRAKNKSDLKALISHLRSSKDLTNFVEGKSNGILTVLNQDGAPSVENLHVEHGYQFGWSLTVISLLALMVKIEVTALGKSTVSEAAMIAYWQGMDMMQLVDQEFEPCIVCSKETYATACALAWSKLQKKKRRWTERRYRGVTPEVKLDVIDQILKATLGPTERHIEELNCKMSQNSTHDNIATTWSEQTVMSYTMHTVCQNLLRCWMDVKAAAVATGRRGEEHNVRKMIEGMVEHINMLIGEVLACCLSNLPIALDRSTTAAVLSGRMSKIEEGLIMVAQGKRIWEELQWPATLHSPSLGHLRQWMQLADISNACRAS